MTHLVTLRLVWRVWGASLNLNISMAPLVSVTSSSASQREATCSSVLFCYHCQHEQEPRLHGLQGPVGAVLVPGDLQTAARELAEDPDNTPVWLHVTHVAHNT